MKHAPLALLAGIALVAAAQPAAAGIVNVQSVISVEAEPGLSGSVTGALDLRRGNVERFVFNLSPTVRYRLNNNLFIAYGSSEYDQDNRDINKVFGHARYRYILSPRITAELFTQVEQSSGRNIDLRALVGAGPLVQLVDTSGGRLAWGLAYMFEYEDVNDDVFVEGESDPGGQHRVSTYLTGSYELDKKLQFVETIYVQPLLTSPEDVRLLNESQISVSLTTFLALNISFNLSYDTKPNPERNEKFDVSFRNSLTLQF